MEDFSKDISTIGRIGSVATMLDVVCRITGMGFAAVARVTEDRWVACSVLDHISFGLQPGGELEVETTLCHEIREAKQLVVIDHVDEDATYRNHHTPRLYGFQSYISAPILMPGGKFFGTLCAIDPKPASLKNPAVTGMFTMFAELIAFHLDAMEKIAASETSLLLELENSKFRDEFIAVLGHDLRNPLGGITMGAALLKEGELEPEADKLVDLITDGAGRMAGLLDNVMDFTRGRLGGNIPLERTSFSSPLPVLEQLVSEALSSWPGRTIESRFAIGEPVLHDPERLAQLAANLLGNALAHGKPGQPVHFSAETSDGRFELKVCNEAEPIPPEVLARLFEPFVRGDENEASKGLGLGLYIATQIAKAHNGTIRASSTPQETSFIFSMPLEKARA